MKESETDRELVDLIKGTMDKHEEKYILGAWENFVRIKRRRKRFVLWLTGAGIAASLITGWIGFRVLFSDFSVNSPDDIFMGSDKMGILHENKVINDSLIILQVPPLTAESKNLNSPGKIAASNKVTNINPASFKNQTKSESSLAISESGVKKEIWDLNRLNAKQITITLFPDTMDSLLAYIQSPYPFIGSDVKDYKTGMSVRDTVSVKSNMTVSEGTDFSNKNRLHRIRLSFSISPGITSTVTSSAFNISGGFSADYELSRNLLVSTGLQVENQNVVSESSDSPSWIPPDKTQAELVDIDVPIYLKWKFLIAKSTSYYLGSGISSVIYLSEKYTNTSYTQKMVQRVEMSYGEPSVSYQLENVANTDHKKENPLSSFDLAGRINIIFGIERNISSRLFLHLEPYIKIPVSDLATRDLRFTTSGINCKISF